MIKLSNLSVKNFLSVGNSTQAINLNKQELVLVLGENLDLGGEAEGSRNGCGKTLIINAISYALYGWAISDIKKEHLINKSNGKNMVVTLDFEVNNHLYRIIRGRKPNILEFYENGVKRADADTDIDSAQGDSRNTQLEIEKLIGMSQDMFCQLVVINTYTTPFLFQKINDQRTIIEQLLGITLLSEKAEKLKEEVKGVRAHISEEEVKIRAVESANKRIQQQIDNLIQKQAAWQKKKDIDCVSLQKRINLLSKIDIEAELALHTAWQEWDANTAQAEKLAAEFDRLDKSFIKEKNNLKNLEQDFVSLQQQKCHTCDQRLQDHKHAELLENTERKLEICKNEIAQLAINIALVEKSLTELPQLEQPAQRDYNTVTEAHDHRNKLTLLHGELEQKLKEHDPYTEQITAMQNNALEVIDFSTVNALSRFAEHQEFLLKLLISKDSFIRKKIIDQNLSYLNARLGYYLSVLGLPHEVIFQNDLSVSISELGRDLSPGNLSRGEMTRLSLGLSFSFRDVWEGLFHRINLLMIDESMDNGLDAAGADSAVKLLRDMNREQHRDVWLISHKDEVRTKCTSICKVIKENGFTSFEIID